MKLNISKLVLNSYPKATSCLYGHIGEVKLSFHQELADDKYDLFIVERCSHCDIPLRDEYASLENSKRYYAGLEPIAQW